MNPGPAHFATAGRCGSQRPSHAEQHDYSPQSDLTAAESAIEAA
jgi:hypothetical protein